MKSLWLLTKKNLKLLVRSKSSGLVIFLAPLLIILILGLSYSSSSNYGLNIGVHAESFTEDVNSLIGSLQEQEFRIVKYESNIEECVEDIKQGFVHTCVSVPGNLKVEDNQQKEITFYIDPSEINLVWMIQETLGNKFNLKSQEISKELTGNILSQLSDTKDKVAAKSGELNTVKDKTSSASGSVSSLKENIQNIDLNVPIIVYDTAVVDSFRKKLDSEVEDSKSAVANAISDVENAEIEGGNGAILNSLNDADKSLDKITELSEGNKSKFEDVSELVSSLQHDLIQAQTKLMSASETIEGASSSLDSTTSAIQESITAMATVQQGLDEIRSNLESQKVTEADTIAAPLVTKIERISQESSFLNYSFPGLLVLVVMFSSLLLGTTLVMMEKNSPAFFRNYFLPLKKGTFVISTYLTNSIITVIQVIIILGVSLFFLKGNPLVMLPVAGILLISSSVFAFMGMTIGYVFRSEETGTLASISLGSFLLFVSGLILPLESISTGIRKIASFNPFVISEKVIRELFIFKAPISTIWEDILILVGYAVVLFAAIIVIDVLLHKHFREKLNKRQHKENRHKEKIENNNV